MNGLVLAMLAGLELETPAPDVPRAVIYGYPIATAALPARSLVAREWGFDVPLGASVRINETTSVDFELQLMTLSNLPGRSDGWLGSVAIGPSVRLWRGLYADAHARFTLAQPLLTTFHVGCAPGLICPLAANGPGDIGPGFMRVFTAEIDIGYAWTFGRLYLSPAIGIGGGYAFDYDDPTGVGLLTPFSQPTFTGHRTDRFVWTVNLNLLRVGVAL
jgi:hypothetical protein